VRYLTIFLTATLLIGCATASPPPADAPNRKAEAICDELARAELGIRYDMAGPELAEGLRRYFLTFDAVCERT
jgi:hypothetical protein